VQVSQTNGCWYDEKFHTVCWKCLHPIRQGQTIRRGPGYREVRHIGCERDRVLRIPQYPDPVPPTSDPPNPSRVGIRVVVTGGRDYHQAIRVYACLDSCEPINFLAHGGSTGVDDLAGRWARLHGLLPQVFYADWDRYGNGAGPIRNRIMLDTVRPDLVIAFPGHTGTRDCIAAAEQRGLAVWRTSEGTRPSLNVSQRT
jgi:hypothetical protein